MRRGKKLALDIDTRVSRLNRAIAQANTRIDRHRYMIEREGERIARAQAKIEVAMARLSKLDDMPKRKQTHEEFYARIDAIKLRESEFIPSGELPSIFCGDRLGAYYNRRVYHNRQAKGQVRAVAVPGGVVVVKIE